MQIPQEILALAVIILFAAILFAAIRASRQQNQARQKTLDSLGFRPWTLVDSRFTDAVRRLELHGRSERLEIRQAFMRRLPDMQLVFFDLADRQDHDSHDQRNKLAIYLPGDNLPEFRLFPRMNDIGDGLLANMAEKAIEGLVEYAVERSGQTQLDFFDQPEAYKQFIITARDEELVYSYLTPDRMQRLGSMPRGFSLQVGGELILIDTLNIQADRRPIQDSINQLVDLAMKVSQIFLH
jgi:hypothetical protein